LGRRRPFELRVGQIVRHAGLLGRTGKWPEQYCSLAAKSSDPLYSRTAARTSHQETTMSERVRVHMRVPGTAPMPQLMRLIQDIEAAGFEGAGILDSQVISREDRKSTRLNSSHDQISYA